jgi:hypothetical protein
MASVRENELITSHRPPQRPEIWPVVLMLLYGVCIGVMMTRHEMWRDEVQAWLLARDAATWFDVLANSRYERHPWLWYALLWPLTRLTSHPVAMQGLHLLVVMASAWVLLRFAPFPRWLRVLMLAGYFFSYEWAVLSRNYALSVLLLFTFCALYARRWRTLPWIGLVLGLASLTNVLALLIAAVLAGALVAEGIWLKWRHAASRLVSARRATVALVLWALGCGAGLYAAYPPASVGLPAPGSGHFTETRRIASSAHVVLRAFAPVPENSPSFWVSNRVVEALSQPGPATAAATALLLLCALFYLRRPRYALLFLAGALLLLSFFHTIKVGDSRHHGFLYLWCWLVFWLSESGAASPPARPWRNLLLVPVLLVHIAGTALAWRWEWSTAFSQGQTAATWIQGHFDDVDQLIMAGAPSPHASTVVAFLGRDEIYYLDQGGHGSYIIWDSRVRLNLPHEELLERLDALRPPGDSPVLLILQTPLAPAVYEPRGIHHLKSFDGPVTTDETIHLYQWPGP